MKVQDKVALNVSEVAELMGISRTKVYELIHRDDFPAFKIGSRTVIPRSGLEKWVNSQPKNF